MDNKMFCYQCEQTAGCGGCTGAAGVCGKTADVAKLQDELTGALVALARGIHEAPEVGTNTWRMMIKGCLRQLPMWISMKRLCANGLLRCIRRRKGFADRVMITLWRMSGMHRRISEASNPSFFSVCAAWLLIRIIHWYWAIRTKK